jgi:ankyrin repeat protein
VLSEAKYLAASPRGINGKPKALRNHLEVSFGVWTRGAIRWGCGMENRDKKLLAAVRENDWTRVKELLEAGADPDGEGPFGPLIFLALLLGHTMVTRLLVEAGADVAVTDDLGRTPLHWAAKAGDQELIVAMMEGEADPLAMDRNGETPLDTLLEYGHDKVLEMIKRRYPKEYRRWAGERIA